MKKQPIEVHFTDEQASIELDKSSQKAAKLFDDSGKIAQFIQRAEKKFKRILEKENVFSTLPTLLAIIKSYLKKEYCKFPVASIITILGALIYVVTPIDAISDLIPVVGYFDDAAVIQFCLDKLHKEIAEYNTWLKQKAEE